MNADSHPRAHLGEHKTEGRSHHERGHDVWSASATSRNVVCAGAIALSTLCEDRESEAAAWGSAAHQISERCLRGNLDAISFVGRVEKSGKFEFSIDEEMSNTAQTYVDYCRRRMQEYFDATGEHAEMWIEQKLSLDSLNPPLEAGGTGDCIIYFRLWKLVEIVDLKGGRGVTVAVAGNPQGRSYGIGTLLTFTHISVDHVMVTIVQPRVGDGLPKSETFHVSELLDWTVDILAAMQRSKDALDEFTALGANRVLFDAWADKWLATGQCTFCSAQAICPKRKQEALARLPEIAAQWAEDVTAPLPDLSNTPRLASPEELAHWLEGFDALKDWMKSVAAFAHGEAERGVNIPGWQLADSIGDRAWLDEMKTVESLKAKGLTEDQIYERKIKSPAKIEKVLGTARKSEIAPLVERPVRGTNLVSVAKTTRPPAKTAVERFAEDVP